MKTAEKVEHILPAYWAGYLINGDDSGIEPSEKRQAGQFLKDNGLPMPVSCSSEQFFQWGNDATPLGGDCLIYTFLTP
jgi:hypothetical protein